MLERYFRRARVLRRIQENPIHEQIKQFVGYLDGRGHPRTTIHSYVQVVEHFGTWLGTLSRRRRLVDQHTVDEFLERHLPDCSCPTPAPRHVNSTRAALRHLLRAVGESVEERPRSSSPRTDQLIEQYVEHLEENCGLASETQQYRARYAQEFLNSRFPKGKLKLKELKPQDAAQFVADYAVRCKRSSAQVAASALRSFLRFLHMRGFCDATLVRAVPSIPLWKLSSLPKTMTEEQLHCFLDTFDRSTSTGRRDYALALSMVRLGLRVSEVSKLKLQDMDWRNGRLRIHSAKRRRSRELPLPRDVGSAIASYVKSGRPNSSCNSLFLRHTVPVGTSVSRELVRGVIRRAYKRSGCSSSWTGTHVLRHTAATRLHQHGASLKEIADLLGHRSIDTSMIYTKVDVPTLSSVALPWPEKVQS